MILPKAHLFPPISRLVSATSESYSVCARREHRSALAETVPKWPRRERVPASRRGSRCSSVGNARQLPRQT
jgi:hypothetical protein